MKTLNRAKTLPCLLLAALACCLATEARADPLVLDPAGDTFGAGVVQHDITSVSATYTSTLLTFTVNFAGPVAAPSAANLRGVFGFIDIDADRNPLTGADSFTAFFAPPPAPALGAEYGIDLAFDLTAPGFVEVFDAVTGAGIGVAPITFSVNSFSIDVPLALIGGNGFVNYAAVVGTSDEPTDKVPNGMMPATSAAAAAVPEPATMLLLGAGLTGVGAIVRRRRRKD